MNHTNSRARGKAAFLLMAAAMAATVYLYAPARNMVFFFDDSVTILHNQKLQSENPLTVLSENPFRAVPNVTFAIQHRLGSPELPEEARDLEKAAPRVSRQYYPEYKRVLPVYQDPGTGEEAPVSVALERGRLFPRPDPLPFRAFNLVVHMLNSLLLFVLVLRLSRSPLAAALSGALLLLHPLATEPVNYVTARFTLLALFFSLASVLSHIEYGDGPAGRVLATFLFIMALLSKETAAVLPIVVLALDVFRRRISYTALLWLFISGAYFLLRMQWLVVPGTERARVLPWHSYMLLEQRVFWVYMAKALIPVNLNFDRHVEHLKVLDIAAACLNVAALAACVLALARGWKAGGERGSRQRTGPGRGPAALAWPAAFFLICWVLILPSSSFIPLADPVKEARAYAPAAAIAGFAGILFSRLLQGFRKGSGRRARLKAGAAGASIGLVLACMALLTLERNKDWSTQVSITRDTMMKSPKKSRAVYNYANALKFQEKLPEALFWFKRAYNLDPGDADAAENIRLLRKLTKEGK